MGNEMIFILQVCGFLMIVLVISWKELQNAVVLIVKTAWTVLPNINDVAMQLNWKKFMFFYGI